jgi:hypothetical protein
MTNAQPRPLLATGLPLPKPAELPIGLPCAGTTAGDPLVLAMTVGVGLGLGVIATTGGGAAVVVGPGLGTDET